MKALLFILLLPARLSVLALAASVLFVFRSLDRLIGDDRDWKDFDEGTGV